MKRKYALYVTIVLGGECTSRIRNASSKQYFHDRVTEGRTVFSIMQSRVCNKQSPICMKKGLKTHQIIFF